jgi:hypothetical protein
MHGVAAGRRDPAPPAVPRRGGRHRRVHRRPAACARCSWTCRAPSRADPGGAAHCARFHGRLRRMAGGELRAARQAGGDGERLLRRVPSTLRPMTCTSVSRAKGRVKPCRQDAAHRRVPAVRDAPVRSAGRAYGRGCSPWCSPAWAGRRGRPRGCACGGRLRHRAGRGVIRGIRHGAGSGARGSSMPSAAGTDRDAPGVSS